MLKLLRSLLPSRPLTAVAAATQQPPADAVCAEGVDSFQIAPHVSNASGFPMLDWQAAGAWADAISDAKAGGAAWAQLERAWIDHLRLSLGDPYAVCESGNALLLSTLDTRLANTTLAFMGRTLGRVIHVLDGMAQSPDWGKDILIIFDDEDSYYRYVSQYYPDSGSFAASGGMYINFGCGHFVTVKSDMHVIEPVIAHEMTHSCLAHLPIPTWLNEGLAVNTEQRLCSPPPPLFTAYEMHAKHLAFWGEDEIQQFWSGQSFLRSDDGNLLSYDLARILVSQFSANWPSFQSFVCHATAADGGESAAAQFLQIDLGAAACALLEKESSKAWRPLPGTWPAP